MIADGSIRAVFFDLDGTLVFHEPDSFGVISSFCADIGQPLSAEAERHARRARHRYFVDSTVRDQLASLGPDEFWLHFNRHLLEEVRVSGDLELLARTLTDRFEGLDSTYHCPEAGCRTLAQLRARGYALGLITNRSDLERFHELMDDLELWPLFDLVLAAGDVGVHKPDPGIFVAALNQVGTEAAESLYVGDNYWADVVGARRAQVTPVLYDPHGLFPQADCLTLRRIDDLLERLP